MGKKIFVSYKYADAKVQSLPQIRNTTVRDYVDKLEGLLESEDHIYKGEDDGEDMGTLEDSTIGSKLGDKIFDSTVTIVLISKGMKNEKLPEKKQWIPWEISYSLKEQSRNSGNSKTNAVLAVVLPDENGSYAYYIEEENCPSCKSRLLKTNILFGILKNNMFNIKKPIYTECEDHKGNLAYSGNSSFIHSVKWGVFINDINKYVDLALEIRKNINEYEITKTI